MSPYDVLRVSPEATDEDIRKAYLAMVRLYPPEQEPERFRQISAAYSLIKDEKSRLSFYLFNRAQPFERPHEAVLIEFRTRAERKPPSFDAFKALLRRTAAR